MSTRSQMDILGKNAIPVDKDAVITLTKENYISISQEERGRSKILRLSHEWSFNEVFGQNPRLNLKNFPHLSILIIGAEILKLSSSVTKEMNDDIGIKLLCDWFQNRPMIVQLTSKDENITRFYYKEENSEEFHRIKEQTIESEVFEDFSTFLWLYLNGKIEDFEDLMLKKLPKVENSSLILRFLKTLELSEDFFDNLVLKCAAVGSTVDLLAAIDGYTDDRGEVQGYDAENFITGEINSTSVLHSAIQNRNQEVFHFLVKKCSKLIQQLPFKHQVEVSTAAFTTNQLEVLCNLLEFCDFPFPREFDPGSVTNEKLSTIIKFHKDVIEGKLEEIEAFAKNHPNLKFAYSPRNKSAFWHALDSSKFEAFFRLKALGFEDRKISFSVDDIENDEERATVSRFARIQRKENVENSIHCENKAVLLLAVKSFIFRRHNNAQTKDEQMNKILNWYAEIYRTKFGSKLFDAAAQCDDLKIIFDFEYQSVKNVDVSASDTTLGATYATSKWIFVGAQLTGEQNREQEIKGVIAHEICHYVMRLVYQNNDHPYYEDDEGAARKFDEITTEIELKLFPSRFRDKLDVREEENEAQIQSDDEIEANNEEEGEKVNEPLDDECEGIISLVYTAYYREDWQPELIVRPVHIQAQFDDNEEKVKQLEEKYKNLFEFCEKFLVPELEKFNLKERENVQNFNKMVGVLPEIQSSKIKLSKLQEKNELMNNQVTIVTTNAPKIFLIHVHMLHKQQLDCGKSLDFRNVFVTTKCLDNSFISKKFKEILRQETKFNLFVDCSGGFSKISELTECEKSKFIFIVSNEKQCEELSKNFQERKIVPSMKSINYNWDDLTAKTHEHLLETKINFQNNSTFSLSELISNEMDPQHRQLTNNEDFAAIFDDQLLNLLVEKSKISISTQSGEEIDDKCFKILFQSRNFIKNITIEQNQETIHELGKIATKPQEESFDKKNLNFPSRKPNVIKHSSEASVEYKSNQIQQIKEDGKPLQISYEQMLEDIENKKFVLISDKAGSGKSWILKNFTNKLREKYPKKWTTYVDLKQFIKEFKTQTIEIDFASFMADKIIKPKRKYEVEIFKKLYKNGQVCILFDGFDEIAPDCAEFVTKLFQSFQQNGQNQLWIATRDYFEVNLKKKLDLDIVYKLDEFTEEHGVELIATSWELSEMDGIVDGQSEDKLDATIKYSSNVLIYKHVAEKLNEKIPKSQTYSIGLPQFYKMIADITKNDKNSAINYTTLKIFERCVDMKYERWSREKGELRARANTESQQKEQNYHRLHQTFAMQSLFPEELEFYDLNFEDTKEWSEEELIACGLLSKKGENFFFLHETFREFYAAKFILRILTMRQIFENVHKFLVQVLTLKKYGIIRMFLNEAFEDKSAAMKIEKNMQTIVKVYCKNIDKIENLHQIFEEGLANLADFLIKVFQQQEYEQIKKVIFNNKFMIVSAAEHADLFIKLQNFIVDFFDENDCKQFLMDNAVFLPIVGSNLDANILQEFIDKIKNKTDLKTVREILQSKDENENNLFCYLILSEHSDEYKLRGIFQILEAFLDKKEIIKLIKTCGRDDENVLQISLPKNQKKILKFKLVKDSRNFTRYRSSLAFKLPLRKTSLECSLNVLHLAAFCDKIEFLEALWELLLKTFDCREELMDMMIQGDKYGDKFIHFLLFNAMANIIEFTFIKIKENCSSTQFKEILNWKGQVGRNLLQKAASQSQGIKTHQVLWKNIRKYFDSSKIVDMVKHPDEYGYNLLQCAIEFNTKETVEFTWNEIKAMNKKKVFGLMEYLSHANKEGENVLHNLVKSKDALKLKYFWKEFENIFDTQNSLQQFKKLLTQRISEKNNVLHIAANCDQIEFHETLWELLLESYKNREELKGFVLQHNKFGNNFIHLLVIYDKADIIEFTLKKIKENFSDAQYEEILNSKGNYGQNLLQVAANKSKNIKSHQILWKFFQDFCKSDEDFFEFLKEVDKDNDNVFHIAAALPTSDILEFMIGEMEKIASIEEIRKALKTLGMHSRNILQTVAKQNKSVELHQSLWKIIQKYFDSSEIVDMMKHADKYGHNLLFCVVKSNTREIVELTWDKIKVLIADYFEELSELWNECSAHLINVLKDSSDNSAKDLLKNKFEELIKKFELLNSYKLFEKLFNHEISPKDPKLLHKLTPCDKIEFHEALWEILLNNFQNKEELKDLMLIQDATKNNFAHLLVINDKPEIIESTFGKFKQNFTDDQYNKILTSKGEKERNLLQLAAWKSKNIKTVKVVWKIYLNFYNLNEEFIEIIKKVDKNGNNVFHLAAAFSTSDILEFMIENLERIALLDEIQAILMRIGSIQRNMLQIAAEENKSSNFHSSLWNVFVKYFSSSEIVDMINYCDRDNDRLIHNAVQWNTTEIVELTWKKIKEFITKNKDQVEYLKTKGASEQNLLERCSENKVEPEEVQVWVKNLLHDYKI